MTLPKSFLCKCFHNMSGTERQIASRSKKDTCFHNVKTFCFKQGLTMERTQYYLHGMYASKTQNLSNKMNENVNENKKIFKIYIYIYIL